MMKYSTLTLFCLSLLLSVSAVAQNSIASLSYTDSMVMVPADYLALLETNQRSYADHAIVDDDLTPRSIKSTTNNNSFLEYEISPQYVSRHLGLKIPEGKSFAMDIIDASGQAIMSHPDIFGDNQINIGHLESGSYKVILKDGEQVIEQDFIKY